MNKYIKILFAAGAVFSLASCLKDDNFDEGLTGHDLSSVPKVIELGYANEPGHNKAIAFDYKDAPVTALMFYVRLAGTEVAKEDITVTLDTTGAYADVTAAGFTLMPSSFYTLETPTLKVIIPKGERETAFRVTTNAIQFNPSASYGLYYKIIAVQPPGYVISQNFGSYRATFGAKNKYDGVYSLKSFHNRPNFQFPISATMHMVTTGSSTVRFYWPDAPGFGHPIATDANNTLSWYGTGIGPAVVFDPVTNLVTDVYNAGSATNIRLAVPPAAPISKYDPATKTMYVYWYYFTAAGQDFSNRGWSDTLVYTGPRP